MGCAGVFAVLSTSMFISFVGWQKLYGVLPLCATTLLFISSRVLNRETTEQIFMSFFVLFREENLRLGAVKKDD